METLAREDLPGFWDAEEVDRAWGALLGGSWPIPGGGFNRQMLGWEEEVRGLGNHERRGAGSCG